MNKFLIVDFSTVATRCWHKMKSPGYVPHARTERACWIRNLAEEGMVLKKRFEDYFIFVVADQGSWRHDVWKEYYHKEAFQFSRSIENTLYAYKDGYYYSIFFAPEGPFSPAKMSEGALMAISAHPDWENGSVHQEHEAELIRFIGEYKGSRKESKWNYLTPHEEFKKWRSHIAPKWAYLLGENTQFCQVPFAEADDIIAKIVRDLQGPENHIVVLSTDQDLTYSGTKGYGQLHDMCWSVADPFSMLRKPVDTDTVLKNIFMKIMLGDPGDDIGPALTIDRERITEKKIAPKLYEMGEAMFDHIDPLTWERNAQLIWLREPGPMEKEIQENLEADIRPAEVPLEHWEATDTLMIQYYATGKALQNKDNDGRNWL